jgi:hypothetical protein
MTTALSDQGIQFASGNIVDLRTSYPTSGTFTAGDIVFESSTAGRVSGWKRLTTSANNVLGTDWLYFTELTLATTQATTSGTSIDFTSIPSWVKRITVMLNGVSTNGTSDLIVQIGSGSIDTSGYSSATMRVSASATFTTGFGITGGANSASVILGGAVQLLTIGSNIWVASGATGSSSAGTSYPIGGYKSALSGTLDRLRLTTVGGTDAFDAGSVNIMYEG